jgi:hemoglobin
LTTATLLDKLGGLEVIQKVVDEFYVRVLADETVNHFFDKTDMEKQRRHQAAFISYALDESRAYTGKSMQKAHEGMNLQPEHFNAIAKHLTETLQHFGVDQSDIGQVIAKVATLKDDILYK